MLAIYLKSKLHFSEDTSTVIYHAFSGLCYFTPIFGAMLADQFFGKFKTIFWISLIYVLGHLLKTLAAVTPLGLPPVEFSLIGLLLIALGTGKNKYFEIESVSKWIFLMHLDLFFGENKTENAIFTPTLPALHVRLKY